MLVTSPTYMSSHGVACTQVQVRCRTGRSAQASDRRRRTSWSSSGTLGKLTKSKPHRCGGRFTSQQIYDQLRWAQAEVWRLSREVEDATDMFHQEQEDSVAWEELRDLQRQEE
ncbi:hypothetical protein A1Q2_06724 [Trichosporon asahii var. asahii CBS 8904]|uniref:Uncharacterized protein n=2 Tax=Trichosporon asahii var. asahii TaxID=189963 RepID=K1VDM9_TRIAC|nr:hypothetical protein A1Q1_00902 [Trichosporon asahii var. asahii CBS 2479]EJT49889.1 hypothetical protein A1Q1_00902 [Trichosporon asahii var. asahii CBS 2479]EKC98970.1 hypothetical protein A1Q2_06724 [Trichosporon asahii var. asahii CBS 8904]